MFTVHWISAAVAPSYGIVGPSSTSHGDNLLLLLRRSPEGEKEETTLRNRLVSERRNDFLGHFLEPPLQRVFHIGCVRVC